MTYGYSYTMHDYPLPLAIDCDESWEQGTSSAGWTIPLKYLVVMRTQVRYGNYLNCHCILERGRDLGALLTEDLALLHVSTAAT